MVRNTNIPVCVILGLFYFPLAALFYWLSGQCLTYKSSRLYRLLIYLHHGDWYKERLEKTIRYLKLKKTSRVLEVGCGTGDLSKRLLATGVSLKAIDINKRFIEMLRGYCEETFDLCNITSLNYQDARFDRVIMIDVLHHLPNDEAYKKALFEIKRVLKPDGYAIIWEGSNPGYEKFLPMGLRKWVMSVLDGETNTTDIHEFQEEFGLDEIEPHCFRMKK